VRADAASITRLTGRVARAGGFVCRVPELPDDVGDLVGLARIAGCICGDAREPEGT
jgi:hypothetical protein